jgi:hypothetical protein
MENSSQSGLASPARTADRSTAKFHPRGPRSWSPLQPGTSYDGEEDYYWLEREITLLERALADKGELRRSELGNLVGCKYWGPSRFSRALKAAVAQGRIKHSGFGRYGPEGGSTSTSS